MQRAPAPARAARPRLGARAVRTALVERLRAVKDDRTRWQRSRAAAALADEALRERARRRARRAAPSARWRSSSSCACAGWAPKRRASRRSSPPGAHGALPHAEPRERGDPARRARDDRLGRAARGLLLGLHPHVRDRRGHLAREAREVYELVLERAASRRWPPCRPGPSGREVDAVARAVIERGRPRRALRPRPRPRRGPGDPRGAAPVAHRRRGSRCRRATS